MYCSRGKFTQHSRDGGQSVKSNDLCGNVYKCGVVTSRRKVTRSMVRVDAMTPPSETSKDLLMLHA